MQQFAIRAALFLRAQQAWYLAIEGKKLPDEVSSSGSQAGTFQGFLHQEGFHSFDPRCASDREFVVASENLLGTRQQPTLWLRLEDLEQV